MDEALKKKKREYMRIWSSKNRERVRELAKESYIRNREKRLRYAKEHQEEKIEYNKDYRKTPIGRALYILGGYKREDSKYNRGESDLTAQWIVENIFTKPCAHCGETDWRKIGCNRLDNSRPHTMDNVEPCCHDCNLKLAGVGRKKVYQYTLDGELVKVWNSVTECSSNGYHKGHVSDCCLGKYKQHKGYIWSFNPL